MNNMNNEIIPVTNNELISKEHNELINQELNTSASKQLDQDEKDLDTLQLEYKELEKEIEAIISEPLTKEEEQEEADYINKLSQEQEYYQTV